uniref:F-box/LRR-repeat protein 17 n=1 Tax=Phallusia mammillata TaxID=59560 RepID=A0A6F9DDD8_9ASCI|nr:F-box/LRR-repeat protein 17 [Phallusia mammillata]
MSEAEQKKPININNLPFSVLLKIFSFIPSDDRVLDVCFVCKLWHQVCFDGSFWKKLEFMGRKLVDDEVLIRSAKYSNNVISAELQGCNKITEQGLLEFSKLCPNLEKIALNGCTSTGISESTMIAFVKNCTKLTSLHLSSIGMNDICLFTFAKYLKNLQFLDLNHNSKVTNRGMIAVIKDCKNLTKIKINDNDMITDDLLLILGERERTEKRLETLHIALTKITGKGIRMLPPMRCLKSLDIGRVTKVTSEDFKGISYLTELTYLNIGMQNEFNDECLEVIAKNLQKLTEVHLTGTSITDEGLKHVAKYWKELEGIDIGHTAVTHLGLTILCENLPKLADLHVMGCSKANEVAVHKLMTAYPNIKFETFWTSAQEMLGIPQGMTEKDFPMDDIAAVLAYLRSCRKKKRKIASGGQMVAS